MKILILNEQGWADPNFWKTPQKSFKTDSQIQWPRVKGQ